MLLTNEKQLELDQYSAFELLRKVCEMITNTVDRWKLKLELLIDTSIYGKY